MTTTTAAALRRAYRDPVGGHTRGPIDRPATSTTTEREHDVFTASPAPEREHQSAGPPAGAVQFDPADEFLLGQPRHVVDRLPCRVQDADLWFAETPADLEQAKAFCVGCPARQACLAGALSRHEPWGVWGGEIFDHGVVIARKRPRGRPRKDEVAA